MKGRISHWRKYPGEFEGQRPSSAEEEAQPDDEIKDLRRQARYLESARQPMSERQNPSGHEMWSIIA